MPSAEYTDAWMQEQGFTTTSSDHADDDVQHDGDGGVTVTWVEPTHPHDQEYFIEYLNDEEEKKRKQDSEAKAEDKSESSD